MTENDGNDNCFQLCKLLHFYNPGKIGTECFKVDSKSLFFQYHGKKILLFDQFYVVKEMSRRKCH